MGKINSVNIFIGIMINFDAHTTNEPVYYFVKDVCCYLINRKVIITIIIIIGYCIIIISILKSSHTKKMTFLLLKYPLQRFIWFFEIFHIILINRVVFFSLEDIPFKIQLV
jgi:hypothetical protein